jgi:hypothetical protein
LIALAGMFLLAGSSKLLGAPAMVELFDAIGIGQWFRYLTGLIKVGSVLGLLVPSFAVFGPWHSWRRWSARLQRIFSSLEARLRCRRSCCSGQQPSSGLAGINSSATSRRCADDLNGFREWRSQVKSSTSAEASTRKVVHRTRRYRHGPLTRLMSPFDLGEPLKPFVSLDLFEADIASVGGKYARASTFGNRDGDGVYPRRRELRRPGSGTRHDRLRRPGMGARLPPQLSHCAASSSALRRFEKMQLGELSSTDPRLLARERMAAEHRLHDAITQHRAAHCAGGANAGRAATRLRVSLMIYEMPDWDTVESPVAVHVSARRT